MTKKGIIISSIILSVVILASILFGAVFCLRKQTVKVVDGSTLSVKATQIIETANLKKGKSIFMLDKNKAIKNIEAKYPHIKVVQIKTTSITSIEICVRARHEMYYTQANEKYYIFDEELKVLEIIDEISSESEPTHLTKIAESDLKISESTKICDFVGTEEQRKITDGLFTAMYTSVTKPEEANATYLTRTDICDINKEIEFEEFESFNKIIITTKYGVKLDIENPTNNIETKINICFSTIKHFMTEQNNKEKSGTIKIYSNLNGELVSVYIP